MEKQRRGDAAKLGTAAERKDSRDGARGKSTDKLRTAAPGGAAVLRLSKKRLANFNQLTSRFFEKVSTQGGTRCRRHKLRITPIRASTNGRSLRCSSSPTKTTVSLAPMETVVFVGAQGKVAPPCVRGVISQAHVLGNDWISFYSAACGRRNSLQEGFFDTL